MAEHDPGKRGSRPSSIHPLLTKQNHRLSLQKTGREEIQVPCPYKFLKQDLTNIIQEIANAQKLAVPVEVANFPPKITAKDIIKLFRSFEIQPDFELPKHVNFSRPFRVTIHVLGFQEAERAAAELNGQQVMGRTISVQLKGSSYEAREAVIDKLAESMKVATISTRDPSIIDATLRNTDTARIFMPRLASKLLEVREMIKDDMYMAFLQARDPVTVNSDPEEHANPMENVAKWELIAADSSSVHDGKGTDFNARLEAIKKLQGRLENFGNLYRLWANEEHSWKLNSTLG
ncbi:hypothetical protein BS50DRAFT_635004 [Corynespora cassiicola Philippines]|uniref:RRM domain-containing protein n=1 Tax=Corynespora cassiicola Philippines TaxID=1448308 RepID=A0A2T2NK20_CORCC|nr:hypothetical protein BS50DRAFT_635004 [Corynespora cassiicola Philippines]